MANRMRWRGLPEDVVYRQPHAGAVIDIGDLVVLDGGRGRAARFYGTDGGVIQERATAAFLGVAKQYSRVGDADGIALVQAVDASGGPVSLEIPPALAGAPAVKAVGDVAGVADVVLKG